MGLACIQRLCFEVIGYCSSAIARESIVFFVGRDLSRQQYIVGLKAQPTKSSHLHQVYISIFEDVLIPLFLHRRIL